VNRQALLSSLLDIKSQLTHSFGSRIAHHSPIVEGRDASTT
jgi:hypothetical protein